MGESRRHVVVSVAGGGEEPEGGVDDRRCPIHTFGVPPEVPAVSRDASNRRFVRIRSWREARTVLRARSATQQAGFTAEDIPKWIFKRRPILISDGPEHDAARSELARFFAPRVVTSRYGSAMDAAAERWLRAAATVQRRDGAVDVADLALMYSVDVSARIVGLTEAPVPKLARRLERFFRQPDVDMSRRHLGRNLAQWGLAAWRGVVPLTQFALADVLPAVRARRADPREDVISHLLARGATFADVVAECVTYGTAGMVTTREFMTLAAWRLLDDEALRSRFLGGSDADRLALLSEVLRLDPVVLRLYRRVTSPIALDADGQTLRPGDLVEIRVDEVNADAARCPVTGAAAPVAPRGPDAVSRAADAKSPGQHRDPLAEHPEPLAEHPESLAEHPDPLAEHPDRPMPKAVDATGFTFGDGAHRCLGQPLALHEADALLRRFFEAEPELIRQPVVTRNSLIAGYEIRGLRVRFRRLPAR